ncbi:MAG: hypothetical protein D6731_21425 [Planctomycetota bacterium]|nr:MAG: hypothetical protein D6731_21425 [Planctomycetota bacterium]
MRPARGDAVARALAYAGLLALVGVAARVPGAGAALAGLGAQGARPGAAAWSLEAALARLDVPVLVEPPEPRVAPPKLPAPVPSGLASLPSEARLLADAFVAGPAAPSAAYSPSAEAPTAGARPAAARGQGAPSGGEEGLRCRVAGIVRAPGGRFRVFLETPDGRTRVLAEGERWAGVRVVKVTAGQLLVEQRDGERLDAVGVGEAFWLEPPGERGG